ncbi:MAG: S-methyl-5'-thioadenosine phosphorylase [SAR324 cluster bacterium]|nr:S-methyl-5'-thioadenosine phosphorylase [SAR324 cluster bacterium]
MRFHGVILKIGIIGGSGLYEMEGIQNLQEHSIGTPFGAPSDLLVSGELGGREVVFLPRHGKGHRMLPSEIPFKANIWSLKKLGVTHLLSVSAVGSLQERIMPGHIVFPDQFIDRTFLRDATFFGNGIVGHVQFGDPVCPSLLDTLAQCAEHRQVTHHRGGIYICMEGPAFSTRAESNMYRSWNGAIIGMTNIQEAKLAREAEICFATIALATDYDCWHESEEEVNVEAILEVMRQNIATSKLLLAEAVNRISEVRACACADALHHAILTPAENIPKQVRSDLAPIIGRYIPS